MSCSTQMAVLDPIVTATRLRPNAAEIDLLVPEYLEYFVGHFPELPVVPGVVQIKWALLFAERYLEVSGGFAGVEVLKFHNLMPPLAAPTLSLELAAPSGKLRFSFRSARAPYSSGRLLLRDAP